MTVGVVKKSAGFTRDQNESIFKNIDQKIKKEKQ